MSYDLEKYFYNIYNGFADKRYKLDNNGNLRRFLFKIDDFGEKDARHSVCYIFAKVLPNNYLEINFMQNPPVDNNIKRIIKSRNGNIKDNSLTVTIHFNDFEFIRNIKMAIKDHYSDNKNYAWVKPRLVESLSKFESYLRRFNITKL